MTLFPSPRTAIMLSYLQQAQRLLSQGNLTHLAPLLEQAMLACDPWPNEDSLVKCCWSVGVGLHIGNCRATNEDYVLATTPCRRFATGDEEALGLFVVADGLGGHSRGQEAAMCAVHTWVDSLLLTLLHKQGRSIEELEELLTQSVQQANHALYRKNLEAGMQTGEPCVLGTTFTAVLAAGSQAVVANIGDSRTSLFRDGILRQVTHDHSYVADAVAAGILSPDQLSTHPKRNLIYRALGEKEVVEIDLFPLQLIPGDLLLLCSDGLWECFPDSLQITNVLAADLGPDAMAAQLVQLALAHGGQDNIGVLVARYQPPVADDGMLLTTSLPFFPSASCEPGR